MFALTEILTQAGFCVCVVFLFSVLISGQNFEFILFLEQTYFFPLSDRLSELTYCIHFGTLMAKGMLPAETTFLKTFSFLERI